MSISGDRVLLAAAVSTVDGVTGSTYRPVVMTPLAAWPLLEAINRTEDFEVRWRVVVVLPTGEQQASEWFDEHHEDAANALEDFGYVERIEPGLVATDSGGDLECMIITIRKEA